MLNKLNFLLVAFMLVLNLAIGQQSDNSPYSRFGIGEISDNNFNHLRQMGGLGASYIDGFHINIVNPASYSFLNSTAFDVGVFAKRTWLTDENSTSKIWSGNLEYISLAFPLRNPINELYEGRKKDYKLAINFTLMTHSNVGYDIITRDSLAGLGNFSRSYEGSGGTYKLLWGNSIKYKNYSFGVNLGYLFGKMKYDNRIFFETADFPYNDLYSNSYNVRGFLWNAGLIYSDIINKSAIEKNRTTPAKRISVGFHANSATNFHTTYDINHRLIQQITSTIFNVDTIRLQDSISGRGKLPAEFGIGTTYYHGEKFALGINYTASLWSEYYNEASGEKKSDLKNASKLSIGGYFRPNYKSFDNFLSRVYYRYGLYYQTDPRVVQNSQIETYGVTFGLGMPFVFQRKISHVNLGLNMGIRGQNTPISEKFVKISLGVTFNDDEWFLKRKYN